MSELVTNKITPSTGSSDTVTLGDSGDTFTIPSGVTMTNRGTANGCGGGKVLQVVSYTKTSVFTSSSHSWVDTGLEIAITPASGTKCLVIVNFNYDVGASCYAAARLARDSTAIAIGDADGARPQVSVNCGLSDWVNSTHEAGITHLDTHGADGSTAVTYKLQYNSLDSCAFKMNQSVGDPNSNAGTRPVSNITVMEIGA